MPIWEPFTNTSRINPDELHVFRVDINRVNKPKLDNLFTILNPEERTRAQRFHFEKDRNRFIVARGLLRKILAQYLPIDPAQINFSFNNYGKPELIDAVLQFNLSHAKDAVLYAITKQFPVGIDIEVISDKHDIDAIAERYFSKNEYAVLKNLSGKEKILAFYNAWTRKEAFLKAIGQGLSYSLADVEVSIVPAEKAEFINLGNPEFLLNEWSLLIPPETADYAAALAVKGKVQSVKYWDFLI